jgi:hypothetical protein
MDREKGAQNSRTMMTIVKCDLKYIYIYIYRERERDRERERERDGF